MAIFKRITVSTIPELVQQLTTVSFPLGDISAEGELRLRRQIRRNCDALLSFMQDLIPREADRPSHLTILVEMRTEVLELRRECGTLSLLTLRPRRRSQRLRKLRKLYEEVRLSSVL